MIQNKLLRDPTIDQYTYYDYKATFNGTGVGPYVGLAPMWVPDDHRRRLQAYRLLESYYRNSARSWLNSGEVDDADAQKRREYGDPEVITETALASLLGIDQSIVVPEADVEGPESDAAILHDILLAWADQERFLQKVVEVERTTVRLGDGVFVLGWDAENGRPRLNVYDPGFYFPVLDEASLGDEDFTHKVHIAYEYELKNGVKTDRYLRRITWELALIDLHDNDGNTVAEDDPNLVLFSNEEVDEYGQIMRLYPWNANPVDTTCYYTDATWLLGKSETDLDDLDISEAQVDADGVDLQIDFIPVIHLTNTVAGREHFGVPVVARAMQILDDLISTDTDLQAASAITGTPPIAVSGASLPRDEQGRVKTYGPGTTWETGDGNATMIDTSQSLVALTNYSEHLRQLLAVNTRTPESLLGRIKPSEVPSGIALTLSFAPHTALIKEMRMVRRDKYKLLFKFITRMFMNSGDVMVDYPAELKFGTFLPADRQETSTLVQQLLTSHAISLETAVRMLVDAGFPIESAVEEVLLIRQDDFASANAMLDATGDPNLVRERLGLPPPQPFDLEGIAGALGQPPPGAVPPPEELPPA